MARKWIAMGAAACAVAAGIAVATTAFASTTGEQQPSTSAKQVEAAAPERTEAAPAERSPLSAFLDKDDWKVSDSLWSDETAAADEAKIQELLVNCLVDKGYDRAAVEQERETGVWNGGDSDQYYADMEGVDSVKAAATEYDPANYGCLGPAQHAVRGAVTDASKALFDRFEDLETKLNALGLAMNGFETAPEMESLNADFAACLSKAGFGGYSAPYPLQYDVMNHYVDYDAAASEKASLACQTETDYDNRAQAAHVEMEKAFIAANEAELTEYKAAHDEFLASIGRK